LRWNEPPPAHGLYQRDVWGRPDGYQSWKILSPHELMLWSFMVLAVKEKSNAISAFLRFFQKSKITHKNAIVSAGSSLREFFSRPTE
jgi:hypothetical protein